MISRGERLGHEVIELTNDAVAATIIPSLGGRVWELTDRRCGREWIWHRADVALSDQPRGASYDDVWAGGWEELFPNDAAGRFEQRDLPDHGEWWTLAWTVELAEVRGSESVVRLCAETTAPRARCVKEFRLQDGADTLAVHYQVTSLESAPFHFLFKQHLPVAITPECEVVLPGGRVQAVDPDFGTMLVSPDPQAWPGRTRDGDARGLGRVPDREAGLREFVYVDELAGDWCGVDDHRARAALRMRFDATVLSSVWLFMTYGGWRDCYTAVLEPCTNMPKSLSEAVRSGRSARLGPGETFSTRVAVTLRALEQEQTTT